MTLSDPREDTVGALIGDEVLNVAASTRMFPQARGVGASVAGVIAGGKAAWESLRRIVDDIEAASDSLKDELRTRGCLLPRAATRLRAPLPRPGILLSHGRAYRSHVAEMAGAGRSETAPPQPVGFLKNSNAIVGPDEPILLPAAAPDQVDFEGEIAVVFSRACHRVSVDEAMDHVFGFTIVNDVSARDWVGQMATNPDLNRMGKQFATFAPMGPCVATCDEIDDVADLHLVTRLNGQVMQDAHTRDLIWSFPELIAYYSSWYPFLPGDVLTSGTPAGVGYGRTPKVFLREGDRVSIDVDGVGELSNPVRSIGARTAR